VTQLSVQATERCDGISIGILDIALISMRERATSGDCNSRCEAAMQLLSGELGFMDKALAHGVLRELSKARCPRAMLYWGKILLDGSGTAANPAEAVDLLKSAGEAGEAVAWAVLSRAYGRGEGLTKDDASADEFSAKAAQANYAPAVMDKAVMVLATTKDSDKVAAAVTTIRRLAESGFSRAQAALARFYIRAENGFPRDTDLAGIWGERAAIQGEVLGFGAYAAKLMDEHKPGTDGFRKGMMYVFLGAQMQDRVTLKWWDDLKRSLPAAEIKAAQSLADRWAPSPSEASKWWIWSITPSPTGEISFEERQELDRLERLAKSGDPAAAASVAENYFHGLNRPKDRAKAGELLLISARAGNPISQRALGRMYLAGCGFDKSPRDAAFWFHVATNQGLKDPKGIQEANEGLSESEQKSVLVEAEKFVPPGAIRR
jgi:TPR repeat protein